MDISFRSRKLEKLVSDERRLRQEFGHFADYVMPRLDLLAAAQCLADIPHTQPPRLHQLSGAQDELFAVDVKSRADKWRIEIEVANDPIPRKPDGGIDLDAVTAVTIVRISDHYK